MVPEGCPVGQLRNLPRAWVNIVPHREVGLMAATYLERRYKMPYVATTPMGTTGMEIFLRRLQIMLYREAYHKHTDLVKVRQLPVISAFAGHVCLANDYPGCRESTFAVYPANDNFPQSLGLTMHPRV